MLTHRGFSAWIVSEGKELREFETVIDPKTNKVSCWIPCELGKTFTVHWLDHGSNVDSAAYINLDGFTVPGRFLYGLGAAQRGSVRVSERTERLFQFATPDAVKPEEGRTSGSAQDVGIISLKIKQIKRTTPDHAANAPLKPPKPSRIRRGGSEACVGFGVKRTSSIQHDKTWSFVPYDKSNPGTFVQFVFRYRTADFLLDQGIIAEADLAETVQPIVEDLITTDEEGTPRGTNSGLHPQQLTPPSSPGALLNAALLAKPISSRHTSFSGMSYPPTPLDSRQNSFASIADVPLQTPQLKLTIPQTPSSTAHGNTSVPTPVSTQRRVSRNLKA
ncbi:hypothetical protein BDW22DRAFT_1354017 [Trametopsis cervina]|nr:hypothetical protein BDW22DRAFT_1354017 [Trametopsis cervina]